MLLVMTVGCRSTGETESQSSAFSIDSSSDSSSSSSGSSLSSSVGSSSTDSSSATDSGSSSSSTSSTTAEIGSSSESETYAAPETGEPTPSSSDSESSSSVSVTPEPPVPSSSAESSSSAPVTSEPLEETTLQSLISRMSLKERVYQLFFVKPEQITGGWSTVLTPIDLSEKPVGGILYMGANLESVEQTRNMIAGTQANALLYNGIGIFVAVDEEGGRVARCANSLGTTAFDPMAVYGGRNDPDEAFNIGSTIGGDLRSLGFNVDFAPVADVNISPYNELGDRIFSSDPNVVGNMVANVVRGMMSSGVSATLKHFPGLGAENGNTHTDTSIVIDRTLEQLRSEEFVPFRSGIQAGAEFVMVGHQQVSAFGDGLPADLSYKAVTEMLRGELGFDGIAITDAQEMNTISNVYYSRTAAVMSINAGIDMILAPDDLDDAVNGVYDAVLSGVISEERLNESVTRILTLKQKMGLI